MLSSYIRTEEKRQKGQGSKQTERNFLFVLTQHLELVEKSREYGKDLSYLQWLIDPVENIISFMILKWVTHHHNERS